MGDLLQAGPFPTEPVRAAANKAYTDFRRAALDYLEQPGATPAERLEAFLKAGFSDEFLEMSHLRTRIDLWSAAMSFPTIAQTERALYDRYRAQLEKLLHQVSDPWKTDRIPMVSDLIMATLDGLWLDWMRRRDPQAVQNGLEACVLFARLRLGGA